MKRPWLPDPSTGSARGSTVACIAILAVMSAGCSATTFGSYADPPKRTKPAPTATRVLVAVNLVGIAESNRVEDARTDLIGNLAFALVSLGLTAEGTNTEFDLADADSLEALRDEARWGDYGFLVTAELTLSRTTPIDASFDYRFELRAEVRDVHSNDRVIVPDRTFQFVERAAELGAAVEAAALPKRVAASATTPLALALVRQPRLVAEIGRNHRLVTHATTAQSLMEARRTRLDERLALEADERSGTQAILLTTPFGENYYAGTIVDGGWLLLSETHYEDVIGVGNPTLKIRDETEELILTTANGESFTVDEHADYGSFPQLSLDGTTIAVVAHNPGGSKELLIIDVALALEQRAGLADPDQPVRSSITTFAGESEIQPSISPNGEWILVRYRGAFGQVSMDAIRRDGTERHQIVAPTGKISYPEWLPGTQIAFYATGSGTHRDTLHRVDLTADEREPVLGWEAGPGRGNTIGGDYRYDSYYTYAMVTPSFLVVSEHTDSNRHYIGKYDLRTKVYKRLTDARIERRVELSPDGRWLAIDVSASDARKYPPPPGVTDPSSDKDEVEVIMISTDDGTVHRVTVNPVRDRLSAFSQDSQTLYIRQALRDPDNNALWTSRVYAYPLAPFTADSP